MMFEISRIRGEAIVIGNEEVLVTVLEIEDEEVLLEVHTRNKLSIEPRHAPGVTDAA
jgi:sRNA-binding carbon storage regulator CsrA